MNDTIVIIVILYCDDFQVQRFVMANKLFCFFLFIFRLVKLECQ